MMNSNCYHTQQPNSNTSETQTGHQYIPLMDVIESNQELKYSFALPGLRPEQIEVAIEGNCLQVTGKSNSDQNISSYLHKEIFAGNFVRNTPIPPYINPSNPVVGVEDGILNVVFKKTVSQDKSTDNNQTSTSAI